MPHAPFKSHHPQLELLMTIQLREIENAGCLGMMDAVAISTKNARFSTAATKARTESRSTMNEPHMPESKLAMPRRAIPKSALQAKAGTDVTATFCFVDIAGYTALTDTHGEHAAADLVEAFARMLRSAVASKGHVQELAGDNAFLVFPEPKSAIEAILNLYRDVEQVRGFPILRTGLHHGSALYRANRNFGTTVNTAARIAAQATGGEILCTATVADSLMRLKNPTFAIGAIGSVKPKNLPQEVKIREQDRPQPPECDRPGVPDASGTKVGGSHAGVQRAALLVLLPRVRRSIRDPPFRFHLTPA